MAMTRGKKLLGRKRHLVVDTLGLVWALCVTPADVRAGRAPAGVTGHAPGFRWPGSVGDGTFDVVASVLAVPAHATLLPGYWTFCALMTVLLGMHWMWYALFWRILFRLLAAESANDVGRDEYEGDSDDD